MPPPPAPPDLLTATNISKRFGITQALADVSVGFRAGEVHALMGENGAGKSTLGKVISGLHRQDHGVVTITGHTLRPGSIDDAFAHGVRIVHQELAQCPNLSVAENLCLHDLPRTRLGLIDDRAARERAARLLARLEPGIDVAAPLGRLSPGHRQIVQIAAALDGREGANKARVIVFDEPTSSLSIAEVDRLLRIIRALAETDGITCIYVSHRMAEIFAVCDRVTVLRDGRFVATSDIRSASGGPTIDESGLVEQMIGRKVAPAVRRAAPPADAAASQPLLEVRNLASPGKLRSVTLSIRAGEVLGVGGLVGAGRSELLDAIFGLDPAARGTVIACGRELCAPGAGARRGGHSGPRAAIATGMGYVPEDRKLQGLFFQLGVGENIVEPFMPRLARLLGVRNIPAELRLIDERIRSFQVKTAHRAALPGSLSGGNQQKLLIARWMGPSTRILMLDEPTRGIDVGTKAEVYRLVREAADRGVAVLLVSSEMPELLALSDRIIVLSEGRLTGELREHADMTQEKILRLATAA
ncbi:MAG: sugar ABC transporter ATP-binding protein [Phycisphaerales bacterium]|nr:sugar ABC transporter ATP-binding protein [Phycisphaerales bacterium]